MSSFLTQCPHCLTSFRVTDRQLDAAEGRVRCGACLGIFSAEANRIIVKPSPDEIAAADARELAEFDDDEDHDAQDDAGTEDETRNDSGSDELDDDEVDDEEVDDRQDADDFDGDFDIPLGDLILDIDDEEDEEDEDEFDETEDEPEDEYDDEGDDEETTEDDELEDDEGAEFDDEDEESELDADAAADERAAEALTASETRLIDIVYEEYVDEHEADAQSAGEAEPEPSEEFEPEFVFEEEFDDEIEAEASAEEGYGADDEDEVEGDDALDEEDELEEENEFDDQDEDATEELVAVEEIVYEEYTYTLSDDTDDAALIDEEDDDEEPVLVPPPRYGDPRGGADKAALRNYLADIEDDEALDPLDDDALADLDEPVLLEAAPRRSRLAVFSLLLANFALVAVLIWQYADEHVEQLSRSTSFAPLMPYACRVLDCPEPQRAQPDLFVSEQLLVRSHPRYAQALEVNLVFRNDAPEAQPFPALELGFHDPGNRMVANRLFQPAEYLPPELRTSEMPAQSSIQVTLELVDPGSDAVNYTLAFHAP